MVRKTYRLLIHGHNDQQCWLGIIYKERKIFYMASKTSSESVGEFIVRLKGLASKCKFGADFENVIRDKLVISMEGKIFERLCEEDETLDYKKAVNIALRVESSQKLSSEVNIKKEVHYSSSNTAAQSFKKKTKCFHCGGTNHVAVSCKFKDAKCFKCNSKGHIATICKLKKNVNYVAINNFIKDKSNLQNIYDINLCKDYFKPFVIIILVDGVETEFALDTGAGVSAVSKRFYLEKLSHIKICKEVAANSGYSGELFSVYGCIHPIVEFKNLKLKMKIFIINGGGPPILGCDFLKMFQFDFSILNNELNYVTKNVNKFNKIISEFSNLFDGKLGEYKYRKIRLQVKDGTQPKYCKARPVPFAFLKKVEKELEVMLKQGIISPTESTEWGTPVVPVLKPNGTVRICGDYKTTINRHLIEVRYPLPRIEEIFAKLQGGECFSKLDFSRGYHQLVLDEDSRHLVALNTHKGAFLVNRLPFGIAPASGYFQREVEKTLQGIPGVINFLDDILVTGRNEEEHLSNLEAVFNKLSKTGFKLQKDKCSFFQSEIEYLGYTISKLGLKKSKKNVEAVMNAPAPCTVTEVRAFCGLVNYYGKFVKNLATIMNPL